MAGVPANGAVAGDVFTGAWNGLVPASLEITDDKTLRFCREDLVHQCQANVPYRLDAGVIVVEHFADGLRWTYTPRADGGYDATYDRWNGKGAYVPLATARLTPP